MDIVKFKKENKIVKKKLSQDTTITIKTSSDIRRQWNIYCLKHNINQRATLENFIKEVIKTEP